MSTDSPINPEDAWAHALRTVQPEAITPEPYRIDALIERLQAIRWERGNVPVRLVIPIAPDDALHAAVDLNEVMAGWALPELGGVEYEDGHEQNRELAEHGDETIWHDEDVTAILFGRAIDDNDLANLRKYLPRSHR